MTCPVCDKEIPENKRTCSMKCAGLLANSVRYANQLRAGFDNEEKREIRKELFSYIKKHIAGLKKDTYSIVDFWGGGLFSDYVIDHMLSVQNHVVLVNLYELDSNKKLFSALKDYANRKNHERSVKNQFYFVPFCGNLAKFIQQYDVKNHLNFDFIWLDYCGMVQKDDLSLLSDFVSDNTIIAITSFLNVTSKSWQNIEFKMTTVNIEKIMFEYFPRLSLVKKNNYKKNMATYIFKKQFDFPSERSEYREVINRTNTNYKYCRYAI